MSKNEHATTPVLWDEAVPMIKSYHHNNVDKLTLPNGRGVISGFSFPKSDIEAFLQQEGNQEIERVFIALGYRGDSNTGNYTAILIGTKSVYREGRLVDELQTQTTYRLEDFCEPCPQRCPVTKNNKGLSASDLD